VRVTAFRIAVIAFLTLSGTVLAARAQEKLPEATAEIVQLDAIVRDANGNLVRDLIAADFEVLEDGKKQTVTHFEFIGKRSGPARQAAPPAEAAAPAPAPQPTAEESEGLGRTVLIVVDDLHIVLNGLDSTKKALRRILDEFIAAQDDVAIVTTSGVVAMDRFSRERGPLLEAIRALKVQRGPSVEPHGSQMTAAQAEMILSGDRSALQLAGRRMLDEPGSVYDSGGPRAALEGRAGAGADAAAAMEDAKLVVAENDARRQARGVLLEALNFSTTTMRGLDNAIRTLAKVPGRKICLFVSDGFVTGSGTSESRDEELQRVVDAATRSGAVVYTLYSMGLAGGGPDAGSSQRISAATAGLSTSIERRGEQVMLGTLQAIADHTGGFFIHGTNDFVSGLRRMLEDNSAYYLLAYEPMNKKQDGRFRKIAVKVLRAGKHKLRTRSGYFAPGGRKKTAPPTSAAALPLTRSAARALLERPPSAGKVPVNLSTEYADIPSVGGVALVQVRVPEGAPRSFVLGGVYDPAGKPLGSLFWASEPVPDKAAIAQKLSLPPGRYEIRVVAHDANGAAIGEARAPVEIPDLGDRKLAISSVFLFKGKTPLAAGDRAQMRFKPSDDMSFQLYVYNALPDEDGNMDVVLQAQLRAEGKVVAASEARPVAFARKDGVLLPESNGIGLGGLAPGPYELRIVVVDSNANATVSHSVDFELQ
jgi:VWFA-related protein